MKHFYIAVQTTNATVVSENDKRIAFVMTISEDCNLWNALKKVDGITFANICKTKAQAEELVNLWNKEYNNNETK